MAASAVAFSFFSFLSFILVCIPFPWHLEAWNTGTCLYMFWAALGSLVFFINSVIWNDNAVNWAPVWCDITSRIIIGVSIGIPAASLCINRRLYCIAAVRSVTRTPGEKIRAILIDLGIGLGIPMLIMALQYIVQGHRFNIFEEVGCYPFTYNTWPAYIIVFGPPLFLGVVSGIYAILSILNFRKRQTEFKAILSASSNLNSSRYFRLMVLAGTEVLFCVPLSIALIVMNTKAGVNPWISWEDTHWGFSRVDQFPALVWKANPVDNILLEMSRWLVVSCGFVFFGFFGFADEAQKHYKLAFDSVAKRVGMTTTGGTTKIGSVGASIGFGKKSKGGASTINSSQGKMPIYVSQNVTEKRDSLDTLSDITSIRDASEYASEVGSPFSTLNKVPAPPALSTTPQTVPSSVSPSGSFLDLNTPADRDSHLPRRGSDNAV